MNPALRYLLDEHLRGILWAAILKHNHQGAYPVDVLRVGDQAAPPLGTSDPDTLLWAEQANRVLVSLDKRTLPSHFAAHLSAGRHSPGVFLIRSGVTLAEIVQHLVLAAYVGSPDEYRDSIRYVP